MVRPEPDPAILEIARAIARSMAREDHARMAIEDYTFSLVLWVIHPEADLSWLPAKLEMPVADIWKKGDPIISSTGRDTGRLARQSRCSFKFVAPQDTSLPDGLWAAIEVLKPHRDVLISLHQDGAKLQFYAGIFSGGSSSMEQLDWTLLASLSDLRISLDLGFYGADPITEEALCSQIGDTEEAGSD